MKKQSLGKGLEAMFQAVEETVRYESSEVIEADIERIFPDANQHRKTFHDETIKELAESIKAHGVIQPLIVKQVENGFRIIAGERRYRASKIAGLKTIPVIVREIDEREAAEIALIENLQREDLNPVDEAKGYEKLIEDFGITQEEAADRVGKSRSAVTNALRILKLPEEVLTMLTNGKLTRGHGKALLSLTDSDSILEVAHRIISEELSVRETENEVRWMLNTFPEDVKPEPEKKPKPFSISESYLSSVEKKTSEFLARKVKIKATSGKPSGKITISYRSSEDLEEILAALCGEDFISRLDD